MYYGKGTEIEILTDLHAKISSIVGIKFADFQRIATAGIDPMRYPGCYINSVRTDKQQLLSNIIKNNFAVAVVGWVWSANADNLITVLNTFIDQVKLKAETDSTTIKYLSTSIRSITTDGGSRSPQAQFVMIIDFVYFSSE